MTQLIDLSIAIDNDTPADPLFKRPRVEYTAHKKSAATLASLFPGLSAE